MPIIRKCVHCVENVVWGNILHTVHRSCHPTLQHHNSYNRTDNYRQWNAVGSPNDGHKDARNMLRYNWLPINQYLLHLVCLSFIYLSKMHGHSNIKLAVKCRSVMLNRCSIFPRLKLSGAVTQIPTCLHFVYWYSLTLIKTNILLITAPNEQKVRMLLQHVLYLSYLFVMMVTCS